MSFSELAIKIRAYDHASSTLTAISKKVSGIGAAAKASAAGMAVAGAGIAAVGAGIGYTLWRVTDAAMKADDSTRHMMTAFDLSVPAAEQAKHLADTLAMVKSVSQATGISQEQLKDSVYNAKMMMLSDAQANDVAAASAKLAIGTTHDFAAAQAAQADVSLLLATSVNVLGGSAADLADKFALLQSHYGFESISDLQAAMAHVLPSMKGVKMEAADTFAAMAVLSTSGYQSERIGTGLNELIAKLTTGKTALRALVVANAEGGPSLQLTTQHIAAITAGMSGLRRAAYLKTLGFNLRDVQIMMTLLDGVKKFAAAKADMATSGGTNNKLFDLRSQGGDQQWAQMWNNFHILQETIGKQLLPTFNSFVLKVNSAVIAITNFAGNHTALVKFVTVFAAIAAGVLIVVGGLLATAGAVAAAVAGFGALGIAGPIVAGILAIGVALAAVIAYIDAFYPKLLDAGVHMMEMLAKGILSAIEHPIAAISKVASAIGRYVIGHSPPPAGALRNLNRTRIVETLAENLRPHPAIRATSSVAAGMAMAGMMGMGTPAYAASRPAAPSITINMPIHTGEIYDGDGFARALREHRTDLYEVLEREISKRSRADY